MDVIDLTGDNITNTATTNHRLISAIDPGPVCGGIATYDIETKELVFANKLGFRKRGEKISIEEFTDRVKRYVEKDPDGVFSSSSMVYIECQMDKMENMAIQFAIQTILGPGKSKFVYSHALKRKYKPYFKYSSDNLTKNQKWKENKKNAVKHGLATLSKKEKRTVPHRLSRGVKKYDHNVFDAIWLARYAVEVKEGINLRLRNRST